MAACSSVRGSRSLRTTGGWRRYEIGYSVHGGPDRADRVFDREHAVVWDFAELADDGEIAGSAYDHRCR